MLSIDEAISHCLEVAEKHERHAKILKKRLLGSGLDIIDYCLQCATDHRQLAEWLTELKELRNSIGVIKLKDMKDAVGLLQELDTENNQLTSQLVEAKRLLKVAVEDMAGMQFGEECKVYSKKLLPKECPIHNNVACILEKDFKWRYDDEALKLIGDEPNGV